MMTSPIDRRTVLGGGIASVLLPGPLSAARTRAAAPGVAVTIDDFQLTDTQLMTAAKRDDAIRTTLARHGIKAAAFPAGKFIEGTAGANTLAAWSDGGHIIGNHSYSHAYFSGRDPSALMADVLRCEALVSGHARFQKLFRFPYLAEGTTAEGRDTMRRLLREHGYRNAHVTIDTSDWFIDNRLVARLKSDADTDLSGYRRYYLAHVWDRACFYDRLANDLFGHSIDHTIVLHHRLTTALFLGDVLAMFRARGWRLIDAAQAFATPVFALESKSLPAGQSLVWAAAKARGGFEDRLRYPAEDGDYEAPWMNALGL